jgi:SAM-dependent methyltransferase
MLHLYKHPWIYHGLMAIVYRRHWHEHYQAVAQWIPGDKDVLDVCCGDGSLAAYLPASQAYRGLDFSPALVAEGQRLGRDVREFDLRTGTLPQADIVCIQVSLFQFHPDTPEILAKLYASARERLIVSESVFSLTQSRWKWIADFVGHGTEMPGMQDHRFRFSPETLAQIFQPYQEKIRYHGPVCGGRDWIYVVDK